MKYILPILLFMVVSGMASAGELRYYYVSLTIEEENFYVAFKEEAYVRTWQCKHRAYSQPARIVWGGTYSADNEVQFLDERGKVQKVCGLRDILVSAKPKD